MSQKEERAGPALLGEMVRLKDRAENAEVGSFFTPAFAYARIWEKELPFDFIKNDFPWT